MQQPQNILAPELCAVLNAAITRAVGSPCEIRQSARVGGGSMAQTVVARAGDRRWFVKLVAAEREEIFAAEVDGITALARCPALRVPQFVACGVCGAHAFLLLEHIDLQPLRERDASAAEKAGRALAQLHRNAGAAFGWHRDNFIGSTPQHNAWRAQWPVFFAGQRLLPQLAFARGQRAARRLVADGEQLIEKLPALFAAYQPTASLVHGDLWSGNAALDDAGRLVLFDPAVHYADRETDLAMCALFGGFPERFFAAYVEAWPLAAGSQARRMLYQLYHLQNHFRLFGDSYREQCEQTLARLLAEVG